MKTGITIGEVLSACTFYPIPAKTLSVERRILFHRAERVLFYYQLSKLYRMESCCNACHERSKKNYELFNVDFSFGYQVERPQKRQYKLPGGGRC